jgi:hypothetical protein
MASNVMLRVVGSDKEIVCWSPSQPKEALELLRNRLGGGDATIALEWAHEPIVIAWDKVTTARVSDAGDAADGPQVF